MSTIQTYFDNILNEFKLKAESVENTVKVDALAEEVKARIAAADEAVKAKAELVTLFEAEVARIKADAADVETRFKNALAAL